jgi:hypothetical protein
VTNYNPTRVPSTAQYAAALESILDELSQGDVELLRHQASLPDHTMTAADVAEVYGSNSYQAGNLRYGKLGSRLNEALGGDLTPARPNGRHHYWALLAQGETGSSGLFEWTMRQPLVEAIREVFHFD